MFTQIGNVLCFKCGNVMRISVIEPTFITGRNIVTFDCRKCSRSRAFEIGSRKTA